MALAEADVIVSCLPSSRQTVSLLDNDRLQVCKEKVLHLARFRTFSLPFSFFVCLYLSDIYNKAEESTQLCAI